MAISERELGQRLRLAREACGLTQMEVGQHLDLPCGDVNEIEEGARSVSSLKLDRLA